MITKIISGGQTGADHAGLQAAKLLGLETGGWMPKGFYAEDGKHPEFAELYNIQEHTAWKYPPRTASNVRDSDGTLIFGNPFSGGCFLTQKLCKQYKKPVHILNWDQAFSEYYDISIIRRIIFITWLEENNIKTLNVAGNRESTNPGITIACKNFLIATLMEMKYPKKEIKE